MNKIVRPGDTLGGSEKKFKPNPGDYVMHLFNFDNFALTFVVGLIMFSWLIFFSVIFS